MRALRPGEVDDPDMMGPGFGYMHGDFGEYYWAPTDMPQPQDWVPEPQGLIPTEPPMSMVHTGEGLPPGMPVVGPGPEHGMPWW
jgi:hypothetical protein